MKFSTAFLLSVCAVSTRAQSAPVTCGPGTFLDRATNVCFVGNGPRVQRDTASQPSIETVEGNVIIAVNDAGAQIGYRIGDEIVYFDQMDSSIRGQVPALDLGFKLGQESKGTSAILDYLKTDLSNRVTAIAEGQTKIEASVQTSLGAAAGKTTQQLLEADEKVTKQLTEAEAETTNKLAATDAKLEVLTKTVAADLAAVKAEINQDLDAGLGVTQKSVICLNQHLKFNPKTGVCCKVDYDWDTTKGECSASLGLINTNPAKNCQQLLDLGHTVDKHFWVKPTSIAAFQVWCTFNGDYPGSALVIRKPGRVNGLERHVKERATPCTLAGGGDSRQYCKIHDNQINALNSVSVQMDPYISLSYKSTSPNPRCRGYARKACVWTLGGQAGGSCQNAPSRNTGRYCSRTNANGGNRGMDGYYCNNGINYNQNNEYPSNIQEQNRPFIIWEHSGGSHYCGGHDTTWNRVELWVQ